ncbi:MAG: Mg2+ and Co2+ transporter CorB [Vallitalea sp.]|nr:Mg2+ and Co2+ transporter CorB [Vallitalea sp.]
MSKNKTKVKFKNNYSNKKINIMWIVTITIVTLIMAVILGYISLIFMDKVSLPGAIIIVLLIVLLGIFFDLLGIAVTAAEEKPFHSMAASKVKGSKESIIIIRNASIVANFFNDVIGDISGIISGSAVAAILVKINTNISVESTMISIIITGVLAAITVGGKAIGKEIALRHSNLIVYRLGVIYSLVRKNK